MGAMHGPPVPMTMLSPIKSNQTEYHDCSCLLSHIQEICQLGEQTPSLTRVASYSLLLLLFNV